MDKAIFFDLGALNCVELCEFQDKQKEKENLEDPEIFFNVNVEPKQHNTRSNKRKFEVANNKNYQPKQKKRKLNK